MRAVICRSFDGVEALEFGELADPMPGPGEVLVDVHAAALSFMDTLMVAGRYQMKPARPFVPGSDAAGRCWRWAMVSSMCAWATAWPAATGMVAWPSKWSHPSRAS
jgi:NADPH:quinone reductase-like Zn-dependent oxidoreductase